MSLAHSLDAKKGSSRLANCNPPGDLLMKLMAETVIWKTLREAGVPVHRMGTAHAVTWVDVFIGHHLTRFESEWEADSIATTVAADLLAQIESHGRRHERRPAAETLEHAV